MQSAPWVYLELPICYEKILAKEDEEINEMVGTSGPTEITKSRFDISAIGHYVKIVDENKKKWTQITVYGVRYWVDMAFDDFDKMFMEKINWINNQMGYGSKSP